MRDGATVSATGQMPLQAAESDSLGMRDPCQETFGPCLDARSLFALQHACRLSDSGRERTPEAAHLDGDLPGWETELPERRVALLPLRFLLCVLAAATFLIASGAGTSARQGTIVVRGGCASGAV